MPQQFYLPHKGTKSKIILIYLHLSTPLKPTFLTYRNLIYTSQKRVTTYIKIYVVIIITTFNNPSPVLKCHRWEWSCYNVFYF